MRENDYNFDRKERRKVRAIRFTDLELPKEIALHIRTYTSAIQELKEAGIECRPLISEAKGFFLALRLTKVVKNKDWQDCYDGFLTDIGEAINDEWSKAEYEETNTEF